VDEKKSGVALRRRFIEWTNRIADDRYADWRIGAEFFEMHLVDYDTCSK
jgi:deoxyribodipyrimidine photolyase